MSILSLVGLILFAAGLLLLLVDTRIGIASILLGILTLQWMNYRRRSLRIKRLKGMRDELHELNWLEKRRWFFHGDGY